MRATVPGQQATGMFGTFTAKQDSTLVSASSPVASSVEVHEMKMDGDVMRMREVPAIDVPEPRIVTGTPVVAAASGLGEGCSESWSPPRCTTSRPSSTFSYRVNGERRGDGEWGVYT